MKRISMLWVISSIVWLLSSQQGLAQYTPNGNVMTPKGDVRVLVIYAGFTNDANTAPNQNWEHSDPFPSYVDDLFYDNFSDFSSTATDHSLSNFYYQMSLPSGQPFRLVGDIFPERVNVLATTADNNTFNPWSTYTTKVFDYIEANYPGYDFSPNDTRTNNPNYAFDNSVSSPDNQIDFVAIIWRWDNNGPNPTGTTGLTGSAFGGGGYAGITGYTFSSGYVVSGASGFTLPAGMGNIINSRRMFLHEFGHDLYSAPHYNSSNNVSGKHFYTNSGWGMMATGPQVFYSANAWERWYNGWIEITHDLEDASDNNVYAIGDFVTTGDVIRIKIPHVNKQHLWLEYRRGLSAFDNRSGFVNDGAGNTIPDAPRGVVGIVDNMESTRNTPVQALNVNYSNGIRCFYGQGNFDFTPSATFTTPPEWYGNPVYDFARGASNPYGGHNEITSVRWDLDGNNSIDVHEGANTVGAQEQMAVHMVDGNFVYGQLGLNAALPEFQRIGLGSNPGIFNYQDYNKNTEKLEPIYLNGVSIEIIGYGGPQADPEEFVLIRVLFDDHQVKEDTRLTGELILNPHTNGLSDPAMDVQSGSFVLVDKTGTPNRHTLAVHNDWVNGTTFTDFYNHTTLDVEPGALVRLQPGAAMEVRQFSTMTLKSGSKLEVMNGATFTVGAFGTLVIEDGAEVFVHPGGKMKVKEYGTLHLKNSNPLAGIHLGPASIPSSSAVLELDGIFKTDDDVDLTFYGNGYIKFKPSHELQLGNNSEFVIDGLGVSRRAMRITNYTTLAVDGHKVKISNAKIEYAYTSVFSIKNTQATFEQVTLKGLLSTDPKHASIGILGEGLSKFEFTGGEAENLREGITLSNFTSTAKIFDAGIHNCVKGINLDNKPLHTFMVNLQFTGCTFGIKGDNFGSFTLINSSISGGTTGIKASNASNVTTGDVLITDADYGIQVDHVAGCYINGGRIYDNITGVKGSHSLVFLRNGGAIIDNVEHGVDLEGSYDNDNQAFSAMLTVGDKGCGTITSTVSALPLITGEDFILNIDAEEHAIKRGQPNVIHPNTFFSTYGMVFELCYNGSNIAPNEILAKHNFWGTGGGSVAVDLAGSDHNIEKSCQPGVNPTVTVVTTNYSTCIPVSSCEDCMGQNSLTTAVSCPVPVKLAGRETIGGMFTDKYRVFLGEDTEETRLGFKEISGIQLSKGKTGRWEACHIEDQAYCGKPDKNGQSKATPLTTDCAQKVFIAKAIYAYGASRKTMAYEAGGMDIPRAKMGSTVFPNPNTGQFSIGITGSSRPQAVLFDLAGKQVSPVMLLNIGQNEIDGKDLAKGIYLLEVILNDQPEYHKVIVR